MILMSAFRPVLWRPETAQTSLWMTPTSGTNGPRRLTLIWIWSTAEYVPAPQIIQHSEQSIIRTLLAKICCVSQRYNAWTSIRVAAFLYLCYRPGKPFAEIVFALRSLSTEQLGDWHPSCQKADEAVQCHQGWAGRALRGRQRQWRHQT